MSDTKPTVPYCDGLGIHSTGNHCPCTEGKGQLVEPGHPEPCCWCGWSPKGGDAR